jgi:hypothetical protein
VGGVSDQSNIMSSQKLTRVEEFTPVGHEYQKLFDLSPSFRRMLDDEGGA